MKREIEKKEPKTNGRTALDGRADLEFGVGNQSTDGTDDQVGDGLGLAGARLAGRGSVGDDEDLRHAVALGPKRNEDEDEDWLPIVETAYDRVLDQVGHFVVQLALVDGVGGRTAGDDGQDTAQIELVQLRMPANVGHLRREQAHHVRLAPRAKLSVISFAKDKWPRYGPTPTHYESIHSQYTH